MKTKNLLFLVVCLIIGLNIKAQDDYQLLTNLSQIQNGSTIIFAARHDSLSATSYYAMANVAAGKPQGTLFTIALNDEGVVLPPEITDNEQDFCWTVGLSGENYTFINSDGDMIGYGSSGTDFVSNGANSTWSIRAEVSGEETSVPGHNAFVITNVGVPGRSVAFRKLNNGEVYEKFAPYSNSETNMDGDTYYFYIDIFIKSSEVVPVVSLPTFSPSGGDYTTTQNVSIECETDDAIIYYTLDGENPTDEDEIYSSPIVVSSSVTIKAIAKKDGMINSGMASATYNIIEAVTVSFYDNGSLVEVKTMAKGDVIGELPAITAPDGFSFSGWTDNEIVGSTNITPIMVTSASIVNEDLVLYAVYSVSDNNCVEAELSSFNQSDEVVIAISKDGKYYAMSQIEGSSGQPTAYELLVSNGNVVNAVPDDIKWNIAYSNGEMMIYPNSDDENWLYCTSGSNNNSVRIGTNADNSIFEMKTVEINDVVYSDYLYNKTTERFVGAYYDDGIAVDWRAYKLTASGAFPTNIKNQEYHFFRSEGTNTYCTDVDIPQSQSITADVTMGNVSLMNRIVIESGATLTIDGIIACTNAENLVIKDGAQLVHNTPGVNATLEKEIEGYGSTNAGWYTISSPIVGNANLSDVENLTTNNYDLYRYDESTSMWQNVKEQTNNFTTLETGRGYLYANENDATLSFIGELSCESVVYFLSKTENSPLPGFHLIGNPFSHNIYKGEGAAVDDDDLVPGYYVLSNSGAWGARISNETPITPCQSILVKTIDECDIKIKKTNSTPSEKNENNDVMVISVENADYEDVAYVLFDGSVGLEKINHRNSEIPMIYIPVDDDDYAVASMDNNVKDIPLSFKAMVMGEYTIKISTDSKKFDYIYLQDNQTGNVVNMLVEDYTFIATTNDSPERFVLKLYDAISVDESESERCFAYVDNDRLMISGTYDNAIVKIHDLMGRMICCNIIGGDDNKTINIGGYKEGVYIVTLEDDSLIMSQKIIIQ